ncbi:MAG: hypothetical protein N2234_09905 [Planctomycetota bacterium]|nr:hypothetical protein [Planctomycetota bacterium]
MNCPYAKAVARAFVEASEGRLKLRIVDVEKEPLGEWEEKVVQSGRVVIPATGILVKNKPYAIIGTENIEHRLIQLLEEQDKK